MHDLPVAAEDDEEPLVMAMPRRELYALRGLQTQVSLEVLESIADEHWFATAPSIDEDIDAKEVRLGLVVQRQEELLFDAEGRLVHLTCIPAGVTTLASGLPAIKQLARLATQTLLAAPPVQVALHGYFNDDSLKDFRCCLILLYRVQMPAATPPPPAWNWLSHAAAGGFASGVLDVAVLESLPR